MFFGVIEPAGGEGDGSRLLERQGMVGVHGQDRRPGLRRGLGLTAVFGQLGVADELVRITLHPRRGTDRRPKFRRVVQFGQRRDIRLAHLRQSGGTFRLDHRHGARGAAEIGEIADPDAAVVRRRGGPVAPLDPIQGLGSRSRPPKEEQLAHIRPVGRLGRRDLPVGRFRRLARTHFQQAEGEPAPLR